MPVENDAHVALVGLSGTGKSTVAPLLASRFGIHHVDVDEQVEARCGTDVATMFAARGEAVFRRAEHDALIDALGGDRSVIATGGGIVVDPRNRDLLRARSVVVWLRADVAEIVDRLDRSSVRRPLLAEDAGSSLRRLAEAREPLYRELADVVVDVTDRGPQQVVDQIVDALRSLAATGTT